MMITSPNSKIITIQKTNVMEEREGEKVYLIACEDIIEAAARNLSNTAFKLYMYLLSKPNGCSFPFSPKDVSEKYGCSVDSAREALKVLETKGYITLEKDTKTNYIFKERVSK